MEDNKEFSKETKGSTEDHLDEGIQFADSEPVELAKEPKGYTGPYFKEFIQQASFDSIPETPDSFGRPSPLYETAESCLESPLPDERSSFCSSDSSKEGKNDSFRWSTLARDYLKKLDSEVSSSEDSSGSRKSSRLLKTSSRSSLLEDVAQGNLDNWDPETCITLLKMPSVTNYSGIKKLIQKAPREWLEDFLGLDGLGVLFESLERISEKGRISITDALLQLECVLCVKSVLNNKVGLEHLANDKSYTRKLAQALHSANVLVKKQVFELLSALSIYSSNGHALAIDALNNYKIFHGRRYRFQIVVEELRNSEVLQYGVSLLGFINCVVQGESNLTSRCSLRNEFIGLDLAEVLDELKLTDCEDLSLQISAFEESMQEDHEDFYGSSSELNPYEIFNSLFSKIRDSPQSLQLQSLLMALNSLDPSDSSSDEAWSLLETVGMRAANHNLTSTWASSAVSRLRNTCSVATQTTKYIPKASFRINKTDKQKIAKTTHKSSQANSSSATADINDSAVKLKIFIQNSSNPPIPSSPLPPYSSPPPSPPHSSPPPSPPHSSPPSPPHSSPPPSPPHSSPPPSSPPHLPVSGSSIPTLPPPPFTPPGSGNIPPPPPPPPGSGNIPPPPPGTGTIPPPPPPPGSGTIPPPPPPPGSGLLPPPLPPGAVNGFFPNIQQALGQITIPFITQVFSTHVPKPQRKMKHLNWSKVNMGSVNQSVWKEILFDLPSYLPEDIDYNQIEELFCQKVIKKEQPTEQSQKKRSAQVTLLDPKTSLNVNIFLKQYKCSSEKVASYIKNCQSKELGADRLRGLLKLLPELSEIEEITSYKGEIKKLGPPEQFFLYLSQVPNYKSRVEGMLLKCEFGPALLSLRPQLESLQKTCDSLLQHGGIQQFLAYVLTLGNFINMGSYAGNAPGFKLNTIAKLWETRGNQAGVTLLHYIVEQTKTKENFLQFADDLSSGLVKCSRVSVEGIKTEVRNLLVELRQLDRMIEKSGEEFSQHFQEFCQSSKSELEDLESRLSVLEETRVKLANYYCEEVSKLRLEDCIQVFNMLCLKIHTAIKDNQARKEREEKRKRREEERKRQEQEREAAAASGVQLRKKGLSIPKEPTSECVVDTLLQEIRKGNFKLRRSTEKTK